MIPLDPKLYNQIQLIEDSISFAEFISRDLHKLSLERIILESFDFLYLFISNILDEYRHLLGQYHLASRSI